MHRIHSMALAAGLAVAVGIGTAAAQTPPPSQTPPKPTPQTTPHDKASMPDKPMTSPDAEFAQKAANGSKHEIDGAKFAVNKAQNAEVKALANRLIKDHTAAANELSTIMKNKKIAMGGPDMHSDAAKRDQTATDKPDQKDQPGNESWRSASGPAFDRAYVDHLITEHEKSITLYETEANSGSDAELKAFASKTLPTIKDHLKAAQDLKAKLPTTD
jgi:putative membrane protein